MRGQNRWTDEGTSGTCINCDWTGRKEESGDQGCGGLLIIDEMGEDKTIGRV